MPELPGDIILDPSPTEIAIEDEKLTKHLTRNGFKLKEKIKDIKERKAYCAKCKAIKILKKAYKAKFKNGLLFLRGKCKTCKTECWKIIKE